MTRRPALAPARVRAEIANAAAALIAEHGVDYATAKRKAAKALFDDLSAPASWLPDNAMVEAAVRTYQHLYQGDEHPQVLRLLRQIAAHLMEALSLFNPQVTGAVLNGTASEHSDIHLQLFCDNAKEVTIHLLNAGIALEASQAAAWGGSRRKAVNRVETVSFLWRGGWPTGAASRELGAQCRLLTGGPVGVHLELHGADALPHAPKLGKDGSALRANLGTLLDILARENHTDFRS